MRSEEVDVFYEIRRYHCTPGRLEDVDRRFSEHVLAFFEQHGIQPVAFWRTYIGPSSNEFVYVLRWASLADREQRSGAFLSDQLDRRAAGDGGCRPARGAHRDGAHDPDGVLADAVTGQQAAPLAVTDGDEVVVRGHRLSRDLIGRVGFTQMFLLDLDGELPSPQKVATVDALLVALMEHGLTPSTLAARLVDDGAPEGLQGPVAAGLLAVGSRFLGTVEDVARLLQRLVADGGDDATVLRYMRQARAAASACPGWATTCTPPPTRGSRHSSRWRPPTASPVSTSRRCGPWSRRRAGAGTAADRQRGRRDRRHRQRPRLPAARRARFAVVARAAGLVAHVIDEMATPSGRRLWTRVQQGS